MDAENSHLAKGPVSKSCLASKEGAFSKRIFIYPFDQAPRAEQVRPLTCLLI
jgi:hypothetical protein